MKIRNSVLILPLALVVGLGSCGPSDTYLTNDPYALSMEMDLIQVHNGFGRLLPHVMFEALPDGNPSTQPREIRTLDDLIAFAPSEVNPILPPATWRTHVDPLTGDTIPENVAGRLANHFIAIEFSRSIGRSSVMSAAGGVSASLAGSITVVAYDQASGFSESVKGRVFINGYTYAGNPPVLERWVARSSLSSNSVEALDVGDGTFPGIGFPGTDDGTVVPNGSFQNAGLNIWPRTMIFVVDEDDNLQTYEAFPAGKIIRIVIDDSVLDSTGRALEEGGIATSTVDQDVTFPSLLLDGVGGLPVTIPADLATDIPCDTTIRWSFDESCQPYSMGPLPDVVAPPLSDEFTIEFLPPVPPGFPDPGESFELPYTVLPVGPFNFTEFVLTPAQSFPGEDPNGAISVVTSTYFHNSATDLFGNQDGLSGDFTDIDFTIGSGCPGLVNAPVAPAAIYAACNGGGLSSGIRIIDLDGFGQGTGDPTFDDLNPLYNVSYDAEGNPYAGDVSKFPFNPNLQIQDLFPPLSRDESTIAGGSRGVFTLVQSSSLSEQLVPGSSVGNVLDMMLGHPLDVVYNNYDCLSGRNRCANSALQLHPYNPVATGIPGNSISFAPHPNPPRIELAPACFSPLISTSEPTFGDANRDGNYATNLLMPGNPFGQQGGNGPSGLLTQNVAYYGANFYGPSPSNQNCPTFTLRQQVGHFLYVLDGTNDRVVVLNSNRMTVLDIMPVSDPADLAISTDLNTLAISNRSSNTVTFINTNPSSPNFHTITKVTSLSDPITGRQGRGPGEIVWQPDDEDILVVCEASNSIAIISTGDRSVRKIIPGVSSPRMIAVSNRDTAAGFRTQLYYAYVVSEQGTVWVFESGPDGPQGFGYDDFIGKVSIEGQSGFEAASAIQINPSSFLHGAYLGYRLEGQGAVSELFLKSAPVGARGLVGNAFVPDPNFRSKEFTLNKTWTGGLISSSSVVDIALDDLTNVGDLIDNRSIINSSGLPIMHSSKSLLRNGGGSVVSMPQFVLVANSNGLVDVIHVTSGERYVPAIRVPGVRILAHYWRQ